MKKPLFLSLKSYSNAQRLKLKNLNLKKRTPVECLPRHYAALEEIGDY